jgi:hypothetical protein
MRSVARFLASVGTLQFCQSGFEPINALGNRVQVEIATRLILGQAHEIDLDRRHATFDPTNLLTDLIDLTPDVFQVVDDDIFRDFCHNRASPLP